MSEAKSNSEIIAGLAEEFVKRYRQGERPPVSEYTAQHPELAEDIREFFAAVAMIENLAPAESDSFGDPDSQSPSDSLPELKQLGDFRIIREVGRGGMGVVYEAEQVSLGRHVALKVLPASALPDSKHVRRFEREAKSAAKLHHTNIVPVFGVGEQDGLHYYVMQFIQGLPLDEVIDELKKIQAQPSGTMTSSGPVENTGPVHRQQFVAEVAHSLMMGQFAETFIGESDSDVTFSDATPARDDVDSAESNSTATRISQTLNLSESLSGSTTKSGKSGVQSDSQKRFTYWQSVANIGVQVADALQYAHEQAILHRDIKPSNLLLDLRGTTWVTDFGLAKATDQQDITHTGDILGTLRYMPPEAFDGIADARSDVYSLGLTLYELLVFQPAFGVKERHQLIKQVTTESAPRLDKLNPQIPRDLVTIVHKAIDRDPAHRYQTARELEEDLQRFIEDEPIKARRISLSERLLRWSRRNKGLATSLATVCVLLLISPILTWRLWEEKDKLRLSETELLKTVGELQVREQQLEETGQQLQGETNRANLKAGEAIRTRNESRLQLADSFLDRGLKLTEEGAVSEGLHWMLESLRVAPDDADRLREVVRVNLASYAYQVHGLRHIEPFSRRPNCVAVSPDGKILAVGSVDRLQLFKTDSWERFGKPIACAPAFSVAFSPDGKTILSGHGYGASRWEVTTGRSVGQLVRHAEPVRCVAYSKDGNIFVTGCDDGIARLWDSATGKNLSTFMHDKPVRGVAFSPDGRTLLTGTGESLDDERSSPSINGATYLWDVSKGTLISDPHVVSWPVLSVAFNPNGRSAAVGSDDWTLFQWDTLNGGSAGPVLRHHGAVSYIQFDPSGAQIALGGGYNAVLWDTVTGSQIGTKMWHPGVIYGISFHPQGSSVITIGGEETIRSWELSKSLSRPAREWVRRERTRPVSTSGSRLPEYLLKKTVEYSFDRNIALTSNGESVAQLWNTATGQPIGPPLQHHPERVQTVALSPDGDIAATGTYEGTVCLWNSRGRLVHKIRWSGYVSSLAFSPDGSLLASGTAGGSVQLWDVKTGQRNGGALPQGGETIFSLTFSPDGRTLAGGGTSTAALWDVASRRTIGKSMPHKNWVASVEFSADGKILLTRSHDRTARVWNAATGEPMTGPLHHKGLSRAVFHPNCKVVATGGNDGRVRLWDVPTGRPLPGTTLVREESVSAISFSPEGSILGVGYGDGSARLWDIATGKPLGPPLIQRYKIQQVAFLRDGRSFLTTAEDGTTRLWPVPRPLDGSLEQITLRLQVRTGMQMDSGRDVSLLSLEEWNERRQQLIARDGSVEKAYEFSVDNLAWHDARARDAEQDGNAFAEVWHLDRMISARPDDWFLLARRGRAHTRAGNYSDADVDYCRAANLAPEPEMLDWLQHQLLESETYLQLNAADAVKAMGQRFQFAEIENPWVRLYLIYAHVDDSTRAAKWYSKALERATAFAVRRELVEKIVKLQPDVADLLKVRPDDPLLWRALAKHQAAEGLSESAAESLTKARHLTEALLVESPDDETLAGLLAELLLADNNPWTVLEPIEMTSAGGATLTLLDDGSILASGENPAGDVYTIRTTVDLPEVRAIRLVALPDPTLPRKGPGRHDPSGNFQLNTFRVFGGIDDNGEPVDRLPVADACASFEFNQNGNGSVLGTIRDGDPRFWHVFGKPGEPHVAVFILATPWHVQPGQELIIQCVHGHRTAGANLGRFRLSVTDDLAAFEIYRWRFAVSQIKDPWERLAAAYHFLGQDQQRDDLLAMHPEAVLGSARCLAEAGRSTEALDLLARIDQPSDNPMILQARGEIYLRLNDLKKAAKDYLKVAELEPQNNLHWLKAGSLLVALGDADQYRQLCTDALQRFANSTSIGELETFVKLCLILPQDDSFEMQIEKLASKYVDPNPENYGWGKMASLLLEYRQEDYSGAIDWGNKCLEFGKNNEAKSTAYRNMIAFAYIIQAMSYHQLKQFGEAKKALVLGRETCNNGLPQFPDLGWWDTFFSQALLREADKLINGEQKPERQ